MGSLAHEMTRLREEIDSLRGGRKAFIRDMKEAAGETRDQTRRMVRGFSDDRAGQAGAQKGALTSFVSELRTNVGDMVKGFEDDHAGMTRKMRAQLLDAVSDLKEYVFGLKDDGDGLLKRFETNRMDMARETKTRLSRFVSDLQSDVDEMLGGFENDRADMTKETSAALLGCLSNTKRFVTDLKNDVLAMQAGFSKTRAEGARADKEERERFTADLAQDVSRLREGIQALMRRLAEDSRAAGYAWRGAGSAEPAVTETPALRSKRAAKPPVEKKEKKTAEAQERPAVAFEAPATQVEKAPKKKEVVPDDLTRIQGIGAGRESGLNEAGVYTFAQLAESTPEILREALGGMGRLAKVEEWVVAARKLARKSR